MPRTTSKKQTRLSFAPTAASGDAIEDENDRFARLAYSHPNLATVRPERSRRTKHASPPVVASSSTTTTTSRQIASPVKESKKGKKERKEKKKDKKGKMEKKEKKDKDKRKLKDPEEEGRQTYTDPSHASMDYGPTPAKAQPVQPEPEVSSKDEIVMPGSTKQARRASVDFAIMKPVQSSQSPQLPFGSPNVIINLDSSEEDERDIVQPRRRLKRKAERSSVILSDSDDSEPVVSSPVKRRRWASPMETPRTPHSSVDKDQQEIDDDVRDLQDSVVKRTRTRGRAYESTRDKKQRLLETIRRRRAGQKEESEESDEESEDELPQSSPANHFFEPRRINNNDDSEVESEIDANEDLDRYEDDFVLEDNELGVPTEEIPFEFTRHAYKQPKEYFRDVVAWMVHNRIDAAFPRDDAMYQMAFQKLSDEVKARAGSSLISSVWTPRFRQVLLARPHLEITGFPTSMMHSCDACNRAGHPASSDLKFYGKPYSEETLEPITDDSSDDESSTGSDSSDEDSKDGSEDDSDMERDRDGNILPDENTRFYLGKTCKANAYMAHLLTHWRYQLNEWVVDYLRRMGHMEDAEVLRRENLSQKRKTRNAIDVCKKMEAYGEIERLYRDFHIHLKTAREKTSTMELLQNMG